MANIKMYSFIVSIDNAEEKNKDEEIRSNDESKTSSH
jgi:hypothetical protein